MITVGQAQICLILFATLALAALQNVTVDDAATIGAVVPTYLPSASSWNIGNDCSGCLVKPVSTFASNGTWHDMTFVPNSAVSQAFEFTFVGSGLYIFFILANTVPGVTTLTNVTFILDGVQVSTFEHIPSTSTNYDYNQVVYANDAIPYDQHTMMVAPANDSVNSVLILFDYLIYTTDLTLTSTTATLPTQTTETGGINSSPGASSTSTGIPTASSGQNIGTIVGGIVAGVGTLVVGVVALLCYRRQKRRTGLQSSSGQMTAVESLALPHQTLPTSLGGIYVPNQQTQMGFTPTEPGSTTKITASLTTVQPLNPDFTVTQSSASTSSSTAEVLEQIGQLRDEVARLCRLQDQNRGVAELGSELPEYF